MPKRPRIFFDYVVFPTLGTLEVTREPALFLSASLFPEPTHSLPAHAWGDPNQPKTQNLEALAAEYGIEVTTIVCSEPRDEDYLGIPNVDFNINPNTDKE